MKHTRTIRTSAIITLLSASAACLQSCDAVWDTSADGYDYGVTTVYPGTGLYNPYYWGNDWYPGIGYYPPYSGYIPGPVRPGVSGPAWNRPVGNIRPPMQRPQPPAGNTGGNIRPGTGQQNRPVTLPDIPPEQITGGEPGIAMPPAGSGYRPGRH